jgi:hypothetical protein
MPLDETSPASLQILEAFQMLQSLGYDVTAEMVSEKTGFRQPKPGEKLLALPMPQGIGGGFGDGRDEDGPGSPLSQFNLTSPEGLERFRLMVHRVANQHRRGFQKYSLSTGGLKQPHSHVARIDRTGNGETDEGPDGHKHEIRRFRCVPRDGHSHEVLIPNGSLDQVMRALAS